MNQTSSKFRDEFANSWDSIPLLFLALLQPYVILKYQGFERYADFQTLILFCIIFEPVIFLGTTPSILRQLVKNGKIKLAIIEVLVISCVSTALLLLSIINKNIFFLIIIIDVFRSFFLQAAIYLKNYHIASIARVSGPIVFLALLIFTEIFLAYLISSLIGLILLALWFYKNAEASLDHKANHLRKNVVIYSILKVIRANIDKLAIFSILGDQGLGSYRLATHLLSLSQRFTSRLGQVLVSSILKDQNYKNHKAVATGVGLIYLIVALASPTAIEMLYDTRAPMHLVLLAAMIYLLQFLIGNASAIYLEKDNFSFLNVNNALGIGFAFIGISIGFIHNFDVTYILVIPMIILMLQLVYLKGYKNNDR